MSKKNLRRKVAQKKARNKRIIILAACAFTVIAVIFTVILTNDPADESSNDFNISELNTAHQVDSNAVAPIINLNEEGILEISEIGFSEQVQEIVTHRSAFLGHTIRYEGMFMSTDWQDETIFFIARLEGGCCGFYGFEIYLNDIPRVEDETWVEITGVLEEFRRGDSDRPILRVNVTNMVETF